MTAPRSTDPPKIIRLEQRTQPWHDWRNGKDLPDGALRITASAMSQIMGAAPWGNAYHLWLEVTGRAPPRAMNIAMQRGVDLEPVARELYQKMFNTQIRDVCIEHPEIPWVAASLDGLSMFADTIVEIKVTGEAGHAIAKAGKVPPKYHPQTQWQLLACPTAERNHFFSYFNGDGALVEVLPDPAYQDLLFEVATLFRQAVINDVPPYSQEFIETALRIRTLFRQKKDLEARYEAATLKLAQAAPWYAKSSSFAGVSLSRSEPSGRIDYQALIEHLKVPPDVVEQFRVAPANAAQTRVSVNLDAETPVFGFGMAKAA